MKFHMQDVNARGMQCGVISTAFNESTTIGDICAQYEPKWTRVLRMKDGLIRSIVPPNTKVVKLIEDGYGYRLDRPKSASHPKEFHICVKFIGDSPADQLRTPLLINVRNGDTLNAISLKVLGIVGNTKDLMRAMEQFEFFIDGKPLPKYYTFNQPNNTNFIQVVSLNMNQKKKNSCNFLQYLNY